MKQTLRHIFLLLALFVATTPAWAECIILNESGPFEVMDGWSQPKPKTFTISNPRPCNQLVFTNEQRTHWLGPATGGVTVTATYSDGSSSEIASSKGNGTHTINLNQKIIKELSFKGTGTLTKTISNIQLTQASYANAPTPTQLIFDTKMINSAEQTLTTTMSWSDIDPFDISFSGSNQFSYSVSNNAETCSYGTMTISVTYKYTSVGTINNGRVQPHTATLTVKTSKGTHTIALSGTTIDKYTALLNWNIANTGDNTGEYAVEDQVALTEAYSLVNQTTNANITLPINFTTETLERNTIYKEDNDNNYNNDVISIENGVLIAKNAGKAKLIASSAGNNQYKAFTKELTLTIKKHEPTFTWNDADLYWDRTLVDYFSTTNLVTPITIENQTDTEVANIYFSTSNTDDKHTLDITTYNKVGNTSFVTVTQAENYYWKKHTEEHEIKPKDPNDHVTFTIDKNNYNSVIKELPREKFAWNDNKHFVLGNDNLSPGDWEDKYVIISFSGIPKDITFDYAVTQSGLATGIQWYVQESANGTDWNNIFDESNKSAEKVKRDLKPETKYIKFIYSGNYGGIFKNITVTELDEFYAVETTTEPTKTEIEHLNFGPNQVTIDTTIYFDIKYANAGYKVKAVSNDNHFTVTPSETSSMGGDKYGLQTFAVTYTSNVPYATVDNNSYITITDELEHIKGHKDIVYLHASSDLATQQLYWRDDFDAVENPIVRMKNDTIQHAAHSSSKLEITYTSSDPTVIEVIEDGTVLKLLKPGSAVITAMQKGNDLFKPADSIEKTFIVTDKLLQYIIWTDAPTDIVKTEDTQTFELNAQVHVQTEEGDIILSEERTQLLTYTSGNDNIVSISNKTLTVHSIGKTTLTAYVPGDEEHDYAEASLTVPITVRSETAGCPDPLLYQSEGTLQFFQMNLNQIVKDPISLNTSVGIPGYVIVEHYGQVWTLLGVSYYKAEIRLEEKTTSNPTWTPKATIYPKTSGIIRDTIYISRDATEIRFVRNADGRGYQFLQNIEVHPAQFIESVDEVDFGQILVGSKSTQTFDLSYSNIKDVLSPIPSSKDVVVTPKEFGACGTFGTQLITVDWTPSKVSPENGFTTETITFTDPNSDMEKVVTLKAIVQKGPQSILWNDWGGEFPKIISHCDLIDLNLPAKTTADIGIVWKVIEGKDCADFIDGELHLYKDGTITLKASNSGSDNYLPFEQTFTITIQVNPIFLGTEDKAWENPNNWNYQRIPCEVEPVTLQAPATLSTHTTVASLTFNSENSQTNSLHITSTGGLTLGEQGITNAADNGSSLVIDNTYDGAGFLRIDPKYQGTTRLTMRYQTKSTLDNGANSDADWQYIGAPGNDCSIYVDYNTWLYKLDEPKKDWELQARTADVALIPFEGYAITQYGKPTYEWTANFTNANFTIPLTYSKDGRSGRHIFANSYTAPIDVKALDGLITYNEGEQDRFRIEQTVYIFNSGSWNDWNTQPQKGDDTPGQYYAIPIAAAAANYLSEEQTVIPPMQGFYMRVRSKTPLNQLDATEQVGQILLDYNTVVMGDNHKMNTAMRAPQRHVPTPNQNFQRIRIQATSANSGADRLYIIQDEINTRKYNNGYDAPNQTTNGIVNIYTNESFGKMEVSCSDNIDSLYIGFMAGEDSLYTLTFGAQRGEIYLKDLQNDSIIHMLNGKQYHFIATPHSTNDLRFQVLLHPDFNYDFSKEEKDEIITNVTDIPATQVWSDGKIVYIANAPINSTAKVFNISGQALLSTTINCMPYTLNLSHLSAGVYMLQLNNKVYKFVCK